MKKPHLRIDYDETEGVWKDPESKEVLTYTNWRIHKLLGYNSSYNNFSYQDGHDGKMSDRRVMSSNDGTWLAINPSYYGQPRFVVCETI